MDIYSTLSELLLIDEADIASYINRAPHRYKVYKIPKRNGSGSRVIAQPAKELKVLQKAALNMPLLDLPIHKSAFAYMDGIGIKQNAQKHSKNQYLLKMDFSDFFPSITSNDLVCHVEKHKEKLEEKEKVALKKLFFWCVKGSTEHRLSIGAPSSPFLSNTMLFDFDTIVNRFCIQEKITYTRYADDLTFTTNVSGLLFELPKYIEGVLKDIEYPNLKINQSKTVFSSKKNNRHVTGLVLTNANTISIGRDRKRYIRSLVYGFCNKKLSNDESLKLRGLISFAKHIEPTYYRSLVKKYSLTVISEIERYYPDN